MHFLHWVLAVKTSIWNWNPVSHPSMYPHASEHLAIEKLRDVWNSILAFSWSIVHKLLRSKDCLAVDDSYQPNHWGKLLVHTFTKFCMFLRQIIWSLSTTSRLIISYFKVCCFVINILWWIILTFKKKLYPYIVLYANLYYL